MKDFNANDFLNTLNEEQRKAVLACKTEDELEKVIDDYDIDLPDEMLEEVAGGKGFIPVLMAGIIAFSGAGAVMASTSAVRASAYTTEWSEEKDAIEDFF